MRISDWSSDVCSSDLAAVAGLPDHALQRLERGVLSILVDPALQGLDDHRVLANTAVLHRHLAQPLPDFRLVAARAHEAGQRLPGDGEHHDLEAGGAAGGAGDVGGVDGDHVSRAWGMWIRVWEFGIWELGGGVAENLL